MIAQKYRDEMVRLMETVLEEIGPRESCGEAGGRLGEILRQRRGELGHAVQDESFLCHPRAFLGFIPITVGLYLGAAACYWAAPGLAVILAAGALALVVFELLRQRELVDPLFPEAEGRNVVARIPPSGECRRRVLVSAHQDSAYEFNLWYFLKNASLPVMAVALTAPVVPLLGALAQLLGGTAETGLLHGLGVLSLALYPIVGLNLFFHTYSAVPGAMDDLAGIAVLDGAARVLADLPRAEKPALAERVAGRRGWKLRRGLVPFGGTDAAAFARAGFSSVSLGCQDISRLVPNYHTRLDTLDRVRPDSLVVMLQLVLDMIEEIDAGSLTDAVGPRDQGDRDDRQHR